MEWGFKFAFIWGSILLSLRITHQKTNVALGGAAAQSSLYDPLYPPSLVVDGKPHSDYSYNSCVSTLKEDNPWWRVDMGMSYDIATIIVIRRSDCCGHALNKAEIRIGDSPENNGTKNHRCAIIDVTSEVTMTFHCDAHRGRYVNIFLPGANKTLQLCEVRVYPPAPITGANVALGGVAALSTVWSSEFPASLGIDGNDDPLFFVGRTCTSTSPQTDAWWRVDLRGPYDILSVEVTRRADDFVHFIDGAEVRIGNSLENNGNNNPRCAVLKLTTNPNMTFYCNMEGRYVNIFLPGESKILQICEVKVFATTSITGDKVTRSGVVTQSAEPASAETGPRKAFDEHPGRSARETCASVPLQDNPWWRLDLRTIYRITAVSIFVPVDRPEELNGAEVLIGLRNDTSNQRCAVISIAEGQLKYNYHCGTMDGRFVHVVLPGLQKTLTVCEVLVYGDVLENVALRGVAFQSSSRYKDKGEASIVIDGNRFDACSRTEVKPSQWVTVDLLVPYNVTVILLAYNDDNCWYSNDVQVDNTRCAVIPSHNSDSSKCLMTLDCGGIVGRYVTVMHPDIPPDVCEVEVYSTWEHLNNPFHQHPPSHDLCSSCSHDYILIHTESKTWSEAQAYCREKYTDLATINNNLDMNRVVDKMENVYNDFWIGLYEGVVTWRWSLSDKSYYASLGAEFRNWGVGEPNDESGIQQCAAIQHTGDWKVLGCDVLNYFLCFDDRTGAPEGTILVETAMKWVDAQGYCRKHHTDLVSVRKEGENQKIQSMIPEGKQAWIGLFQDSWTWSDGSYSSFRYWSQTRDSTGEGPKCAHVYDRTWSVRSCKTTSMFLCSYRVHKKKSVFRISADVDMSDPAIQQQVLSQLQAQMRKQGISDFKIHWKASWKEETAKCARPEGGEACAPPV